MRTYSIEINVAKFVELNPEQKKKVLDNYRDFHHDNDLNIDEYKNDLEILGFENVSVNYTGFWSQGDGASFTGTFKPVSKKEQLERFKKFKENNGIEKYVSLAERLNEISFNEDDKENGIELVRIDSRYYHYNSVAIETENKDFIELCKDYMREIYKSLNDSYDYYQSDECISESLISNDYEFNLQTFKID